MDAAPCSPCDAAHGRPSEQPLAPPVSAPHQPVAAAQADGNDAHIGGDDARVGGDALGDDAVGLVPTARAMELAPAAASPSRAAHGAEAAPAGLAAPLEADAPASGSATAAPAAAQPDAPMHREASTSTAQRAHEEKRCASLTWKLKQQIRDGACIDMILRLVEQGAKASAALPEAVKRDHDVMRQAARRSAHASAQLAHSSAARAPTSHAASRRAQHTTGRRSNLATDATQRVLPILLQDPSIDPNATSSSTNATPLMLALTLGDTASVRELLHHPRIDVNARGGKGQWTPLQEAAENGLDAAAAMLLEAGADPNLRDLDGRTALHWAVIGGSARVALALLRHGADPSMRCHGTKHDAPQMALDLAREQLEHSPGDAAVVEVLDVLTSWPSLSPKPSGELHDEIAAQLAKRLCAAPGHPPSGAHGPGPGACGEWPTTVAAASGVKQPSPSGAEGKRQLEPAARSSQAPMRGGVVDVEAAADELDETAPARADDTRARAHKAPRTSIAPSSGAPVAASAVCAAEVEQEADPYNGPSFCGAGEMDEYNSADESEPPAAPLDIRLSPAELDAQRAVCARNKRELGYSSQYKGVHWSQDAADLPPHLPWRAKAGRHHKIYVGRFPTQESAAQAVFAYEEEGVKLSPQQAVARVTQPPRPTPRTEARHSGAVHACADGRGFCSWAQRGDGTVHCLGVFDTEARAAQALVQFGNDLVESRWRTELEEPPPLDGDEALPRGAPDGGAGAGAAGHQHAPRDEAAAAAGGRGGYGGRGRGRGLGRGRGRGRGAGGSALALLASGAAAPAGGAPGAPWAAAALAVPPIHPRRLVSWHFMPDEHEESAMACSVCLDDKSYRGNALVMCHGCGVCVHQHCYGIRAVPREHWYCAPCKDALDTPGVPERTPGSARAERLCALCPLPGGALARVHESEITLGVAQPSAGGAGGGALPYAHLMCAFELKPTHVLAAEDEDAARAQGVREALKESAARPACAICRDARGCTRFCDRDGCRERVHVPCARLRKGFTKISRRRGEDWRFFYFCAQHVPGGEDSDDEDALDGSKLLRAVRARDRPAALELLMSGVSPHCVVEPDPAEPDAPPTALHAAVGQNDVQMVEICLCELENAEQLHAGPAPPEEADDAAEHEGARDACPDAGSPPPRLALQRTSSDLHVFACAVRHYCAEMAALQLPSMLEWAARKAAPDVLLLLLHRHQPPPRLDALRALARELPSDARGAACARVLDIFSRGLQPEAPLGVFLSYELADLSAGAERFPVPVVGVRAGSELERRLRSFAYVRRPLATAHVPKLAQATKTAKSALAQAATLGDHEGGAFIPLGARVEVFDTGDARGFGVRALEPIPKGTTVCCYAGEVISNAEADRRVAEQDGYGMYLMEHSGRTKPSALLIDGERFRNVGGFINFSCQPNLKLTGHMGPTPLRSFPKPPFPTLVATTDIRRGEELGYKRDTMNVGVARRRRRPVADDDDDDDSTANVRCLCRKPGCIGTY